MQEGRTHLLRAGEAPYTERGHGWTGEDVYGAEREGQLAQDSGFVDCGLWQMNRV